MSCYDVNDFNSLNYNPCSNNPQRCQYIFRSQQTPTPYQSYNATEPLVNFFATNNKSPYNYATLYDQTMNTDNRNIELDGIVTSHYISSGIHQQINYQHKGLCQNLVQNEVNDKNRVCVKHMPSDEVSWAINVIQQNFGSELSQVLTPYLNSQTSTETITDKDFSGSVDLKFELYKIENLALEQREQIEKQKHIIEELKNEIEVMKRRYEASEQRRGKIFESEISSRENILDKLCLHIKEKIIIDQIFHFMKRKTNEHKFEQLKQKIKYLKKELKICQEQTEIFKTEEREKEKNIIDLFNTEIETFRNKTIHYLIEKDIIRNKDKINELKYTVENSTNTDHPNIPNPSKCYRNQKWNYKGKEMFSRYNQGQRVSSCVKSKNKIKFQNKGSQTFNLDDVLCVRSLKNISSSHCKIK